MNIKISEQARITVNSTAYYVLSYIIFAFLFQLAQSLVSLYLFEIPSTFDRHTAQYLTKPESWSFDSVKVIFSSGIVLAFVMGIVCLIIYLKALQLDGLLRLFFLWGFVHSMNLLLGSVMLGSFVFEGFGYVLSWMYLQDTAKMILFFISLFLILAAGSLMTRPFLYSANTYYNMLSAEMRPGFRKYQFLFPYIFGTAIIFLMRFPVSLYELLLIITPGLMILPLFWGIGKFPPYFFEDHPKTIDIHWKLVIIAICVIITYLVVLGIGIKIG
ncbi:MAG TPA: hypothetical protein PLP88_07055 [Bacteroidales bacterium]|nr:hypothetical protein [Bacteroidales bacterium]